MIARSVFGVAMGLAAGLVACGGTQSPSHRPNDVAIGDPSPSATLATDTSQPRSPPGASTLPATPLTDFALAAKEVIVAAIDGSPIPNKLPHEPIRDREHSVRAKSPPPPTRDLDFFVFVMEIEIVLADTKRASADDEDGALKTIAFLSRTGLKLGDVRTTSARDVQAVPAWLAGAESFGQTVMQALIQKRTASLLVGEAERPVMGNDALFERMMEDVPKPPRVEAAERLAAAHPRAVGYRFGQAFWIARDLQGKVWGFQIRVDSRDGQALLDASPLVRVETISPERGRGDDLPEVPPAPPPP